MTSSPAGSTGRVLVQKFGGTSLATPALIARAAERAIASRGEGVSVVVVVSAMAGETDRLFALGRNIPGARADLSALPDVTRELDVVAAAGEQVSAGLMAIALRNAGATSRSWLGHQLPIRTDGVPGSARILSVETSGLRACLDAGQIPVIAGFQGVDPAGRLTTLGRGGSDTTAVAVAAALGGSCEIYTDVDGIHSIDPRVLAAGSRLPVIGYRAMRALAEAGAKVLESRCVEHAMKGGVPIHVLSSATFGPGTWVVEDDSDERARAVVGIALKEIVFEGTMAVKISVIGHLVSHARRADQCLAELGLTVLASEQIPLGFTYVVPRKDVHAAAHALHALYVRHGSTSGVRAAVARAPSSTSFDRLACTYVNESTQYELPRRAT